PRPDLVDGVGYVDDLAALYRQAAVLVVTSRHEGFGLPVVEAMASGTPVVAFTNSALPEVVGDAGLLVPDGDVDAFARAVCSLLDDEATRSELARRGVTRAQRFSWETTAAATVAAYEQALTCK